MYEAARSKARRGELRISVPIGYAWDRHVGLGLDPDRRLQEVIRLVFQKFRELGSARQVLLWMASQNDPLSLPVERQDVDVVRMAADQVSQRHLDSEESLSMRASTPTGRARSAPRSSMAVRARAMATASRWARGRCSSRIITRATSAGRSTSAIRRCSPATPTAGPATRSPVAAGARCWPVSSAARAAAVGSALLYTGRYPRPVYRCDKPNLQLGQRRCLSFGGKRIDETIAAEMLRAVAPMAIEAAEEAERMLERRGPGPAAHRRAGAAAGPIRCIAR